MSIKGFEIIGILGKGAFSTVFKALRKSDNTIYALKRVDYDSMKRKEQENTFNEIQILSSISHRNIVSYKDAFADEANNHLYIVMEYASQGDLLQLINSHRKAGTFVAETTIWKYLAQSLLGLHTLHTSGILHRDIKCANIFLSQKGVIKLGDLNVAKIAALAKTQTGTPFYASPEVWSGRQYDLKSDIWSLGCSIYELASQHPPFEADSIKGVYTKVTTCTYPPLPARYSAELSQIIALMLQVSPATRPNCEELLGMHEFQKKWRVRKSSLSGGSPVAQPLGIPLSLKELDRALPAANYSNRAETTVRHRRGYSRENLHCGNFSANTKPKMTPSPAVKLSARPLKKVPSNIFKQILREGAQHYPRKPLCHHRIDLS